MFSDCFLRGHVPNTCAESTGRLLENYKSHFAKRARDWDGMILFYQQRTIESGVGFL